MAILPAWINIVMVLLHVTVIQGAGEPEFEASVPTNVLATYDGTPGSSSVTLPCTLSFTDKSIDPQNMQWRVDLTWFKREFGERQPTNLYIWENNYDDRIDMNETRMSRVKDPFEERYNLRFNDVRAEDEGEYCCYLHINTNPSSTACTNLHYKAFQYDDANFTMDCDATDADPKTTTINCSAVGSSIPPMNVQIKNFYPDSIQSEGRMVELYAPAKDSSKAINTVASTDFIHNADGTFNVNFNSTWPAEYECNTLGTVTFLISLTHKLEGDEAYQTCTWIPPPNGTTTASTTTPKLATSEPPSDSPCKPKTKPCLEIWIIVVSVICAFIAGALLTCCCIIIKRIKRHFIDGALLTCCCIIINRDRQKKEEEEGRRRSKDCGTQTPGGDWKLQYPEPGETSITISPGRRAPDNFDDLTVSIDDLTVSIDDLTVSIDDLTDKTDDHFECYYPWPMWRRIKKTQ